MVIDDKTLIESVVKPEIKTTLQRYLHNSTIKQLEEIQQLVNTKKSFKDREITDKIKLVWTYILQDSIYNLKCGDYREHAHWNPPASRRTGVRDINNQYVFGLDRLTKYFKEFTEFEKVLYGVDSSYRDHVVHVFRVWLLGVVILHNTEESVKLDISNIEFEKILEGHKVLSDEEIFSMWSIIALCHDLGYPLEKTEKINEAVEKMYRHLGKMNIQKFSAAFQLEHQFLNRFLLEFISSKIISPKNDDLEKNYQEYCTSTTLNEEMKKLFIDDKYFKTSIQAKYYNKFAKSLECYSHGIISCSIIWKSLFYFLESDFNLQENARLSFEDARQLLIRKEILRAIASHTCPEVYHLRTNTLSFLLILCDELQEWERPRFTELQAGNPTAGADQIVLTKFSESEICFSIVYTGISEANAFAIKVFRRWHEILRGAVDDTNRRLNLTFTMNINGESFEFSYENNVLAASRGGQDKGFDIYSLSGEF